MNSVLVKRLGSLSLPRNSVVRLSDRPDMNIAVISERKTNKCIDNNTFAVGWLKYLDAISYYILFYKVAISNTEKE